MLSHENQMKTWSHPDAFRPRGLGQSLRRRKRRVDVSHVVLHPSDFDLDGLHLLDKRWLVKDLQEQSGKDTGRTRWTHGGGVPQVRQGSGEAVLNHGHLDLGLVQLLLQSGHVAHLRHLLQHRAEALQRAADLRRVVQHRLGEAETCAEQGVTPSGAVRAEGGAAGAPTCRV